MFRSFFSPIGSRKGAKQVGRAEVVPGKLLVAVYSHEIETPRGMLACWSYVSEGMKRHGQEEVVFTLARSSRERDKDFPSELFGMFITTYGFAEQARLVPVGGFSVFIPGTKFLGRAGRWGLMYLPAEMFKGIAIPTGSLTAVLIKEDETDLIQHGLFYRIATSLGAMNRYFPYPPWSDPDREPVITAAQYEKSILSRVRKWRIPGLTVRVASESTRPSLKPNAVPGDRQIAYRGEIILRISREAMPKIRSHLRDLLESPPVCFLTDPYPADCTRLCWFPDREEPRGIFLNDEPVCWATGGFIMICHGEGFVDNANVLEDGFYLDISPGSLQKFENSLAAGVPIKMPAVGAGRSFAIEFSST